MRRSEDNDGHASQSHDSRAKNSLERIRHGLVDTSASNCMIDCDLGRSQVVRLVNERSSDVYKRLRDGKTFDVISIPAPSHPELLDEGFVEYDDDSGERIKDTHPSPEAWASRLGINTDFDLPDSLPNDDKDDRLQSLQFSDQLNTQLGKIHRLANTALEESGTHIVYLALGFLEWFESPSSNEPRLSPLFMVPINLMRGKQVSGEGVREYQVTLRDDGLLSNNSLSQRLLHDFAIKLPSVTDESEPEDYFDLVSTMVSEQMDTRWTIRRYAAIFLLDFNRQLMFEDLDPTRWPRDKNLAEHHLLQRFLVVDEGQQQELASAPLSEQLIDEIEDVHRRFPLIHEADSSQHSALIDVVNGNNLVIEGPPGTGKSQTISNLIAACINNGLSVLFVAKKLAALEVVKRRLDLADLGDFCLELHSGKSSKISILNSLMESYKLRETVAEPAELEQQIECYEKNKNHLHEYAQKLNSNWHSSELTPHQILQRATDFGERTPLHSDANVVFVEIPSELSATVIAETIEAAERLRVVFEAVQDQTPGAPITSHPWFGVCDGNMSGSQRNTLFDALERWTEQQRQTIELWKELQYVLKIDSDDTPDQTMMLNLMEALDKLPSDIPATLLKRIDDVHKSRDALDTLAQQRLDFRQRFFELSEHFNSDDLLCHEQAVKVKHGLLTLRDELGLTESAPLKKVYAHCEQLGYLYKRVESLNKIKLKLEGFIPEAFDDIFSPSLNGARSLIELIDCVNLLPAELWRHRNERYDDAAFIEALDEVEPIIRSLQRTKAQLSEVFEMTHLPDSQTLNELHRSVSNGSTFRHLNSEYRNATNTVTRLCRVGVDLSEGINALPELARFQSELEHLSKTHSQNPVINGGFAALDTDVALHRKLADWYQIVNATFSEPSFEQSPKATALLTANYKTAVSLTRLAASNVRTQTASLVKSLTKLQSVYPRFFVQSHDDTSILDPVFGLEALERKIDECLDLIDLSVLNPGNSLSDLINAASRWTNCTDAHQHWTQEEHYKCFIPSLFELSAHPEIDDEHAVSTLDTARSLGSITASSTLFRQAILQTPSLLQLDRVRDAQPALMVRLEAIAVEQERFETTGNLDRSQWLNNCQTMTQCILRNHNALQQPDWLDTLLAYERVKQRAGSESLTGLIGLLEDGTLPAEKVTLAVEADLYQQLATYMLRVDSELSEFDGNEMNSVRQQFQRADKALLALQRQQIAAKCTKSDVPAGNSRGTEVTYSELALIEHEASKKSNRIAIKTLLRRAPAAIKALKPCFMMSPTSVAQYLQPGQYEFDVIIMDEASQIPSEEAFGAIARGRQLVVVGDTRQLPPAGIFKNLASDEEQDDDGLQSAQSILDAVIPVFQTRRLRWHYQSNHESLIAFSNQSFYNSELVPFPSPSNENEEYGVKLTRMSDATFEDGVNLLEAQRIVDLFAQQIQAKPSESVGVIAMNPKQRDQIETLFEQRLATDDVLQFAVDQNLATDEPLFIKNLEHVQGDERDVIFISMTFGPEIVGGSVISQSFGLINSDIGWRRLNVLLTRSRKRMEIVSSMDSCDISSDDSNTRGLKSLRAFLEYCETDQWNDTVPAVRQPDSAFQMSVIRKLAEAGYTTEAQVGSADMFIDIGVRNPDKPNEFLMGIECDGASYYSAKSSRERDRLRHEVLKNRGWQIHRIWSTEWFRNADAQMQLILKELEKLRGMRYDGNS